jgi:Ras-related protein Rab-1A
MSSIGVDFKTKKLEIDEKLIKIQIWDTAGHEKFRTITTSYYKSAHAIIILYDITEQSSFEHIKNWMVEIEKFVKQGVLKLIVGNKKDLEDKRQVSKEEAEAFAKNNGVKFLEVSAKDNINIEELFFGVVKTLYERYLKSINDNQNISGTNVVITESKKTNKKKCC